MSEQQGLITFGELASEGILEIGDGYRAKLEELGGEGPIFLRAGLLRDHGLNWDGDRFRTELVQKLRSKMGRPGDTLVTTKGNSVGRTGFVPEGAPPFVYSPHLSYWRSLDTRRLSSRFLYYWSRGSEFSVQLRAMAYSTDMAPYLSLIDQRRLKITLPALVTQQAIVQILGALDDRIAINEKIANTSHMLAESRYREFTRTLHVVPLSSLAVPLLGGTPDRGVRAYWGSGNLWASAKDVVASQFGVLISTEEQITDLAASSTRAKPVSAGSVILTARGTVGAVARVAQPTALNQSCYAFVPDSVSPPAVLYFRVRYAAQKMQDVSHGTVFSTVNMKTLDHVDAPAITGSNIAVLEDLLAPLLDVVTCRALENRSLACLRDTLLPKLMSGEIRVRDAERIVEDAT